MVSKRTDLLTVLETTACMGDLVASSVAGKVREVLRYDVEGRIGGLCFRFRLTHTW